MGKAKDAETLSVHTSKTNVAIIEERASALSLSKSRFASLIIDQWVSSGCPPVSEPDRLILSSKPASPGRVIKPRPGEKVDPWKLNPKYSYHLIDDKIVGEIMHDLGVPNLFAQMVEHDEARMMVAFDNHPTHWILLNLWKGHPEAHGNGLSFDAFPKSELSELHMLDRIKREAKDMDAKGPVIFQQIPGKRSQPAADAYSPKK